MGEHCRYYYRSSVVHSILGYSYAGFNEDYNNMADVFVSYARDDRTTVARLAEALKSAGYSVWWDRELVAGDAYADEIERELEAAGAVIVGWSASGAQSRWVKDEAAFAADAGKLIAITMDGAQPPLGFRQFHCIDVSSWRGGTDEVSFIDVSRAVKTRLAGEPPAAPAPYTYGSTNASLKIATGRGARTDSKIVAVLPFVNRSPQADDAFFADGVHDELLTQIAKLSAIQVISRTSVMRYRDTLQSIPEIANELGAAVILEGAVQRAGTRVRINVQLIDGIEDTHLWAENFDRELTPDNLFDIQAEITRLIAAELQAALTGTDEAALKESAPTQSLSAYDAYLRGQLLARSEAAGERDIRQAIDAFDEAIAEDAEFAEPHAGKARAQLTLYWFFGWDKNWVAAARSTVKRAKAISPDSIETLLADAYYEYWGRLDYERAESALNKVLEKAPNNAEAWACKAYVVRRAGRFAESITALQNALRLNPMLIDIPMELATTLATFGRFHEAHELMERVRTLDATSAFTAYYAGDIGYLEGRADFAWAGASHAVDEADFVYYYRRAFHALNTRDPKKIALALEAWPADFHHTESFPLTFDLYEAMAMVVMGREDDVHRLIEAIKSGLEGTPDSYSGSWVPDAPYFPVTLPGLMRDLEGVRRVTADYEANALPDEFGKINHYHAIAAAFCRAGDKHTALDYLDRLVVLFGPSAYLAMTITPAYDGLRDEPRFQALGSAYTAWTSENSTT